jgi:hypothetical protein
VDRPATRSNLLRPGTAGGNGGNAPGIAVRLSFDLSGFDLSAVKLSGQWAVDSKAWTSRSTARARARRFRPHPSHPSRGILCHHQRICGWSQHPDFVVNRSSGKFDRSAGRSFGFAANAGGGSAAPATSQPKSQAVPLGSSATLLVSAKARLTYQWRFNGQDLAGQERAAVR